MLAARQLHALVRRERVRWAWENRLPNSRAKLVQLRQRFRVHAIQFPFDCSSAAGADSSSILRMRPCRRLIALRGRIITLKSTISPASFQRIRSMPLM